MVYMADLLHSAACSLQSDLDQDYQQLQVLIAKLGE